MSERIKIDLSEVKTEEDFHDLVNRVLSLPSYYGRNKDAFWDCITDIVGDVTVEITGEERLTLKMKAFVDSYLEMFDEYEQETDGEFKVIRSV